jgi:membrane protein
VKRPARVRWLFVWHDVRNFARRVYEGAAEDNVPFLASGLTFDALLAAIPMALVALALVGHLLSAGAVAAQVDIAYYIRRFLPAPTPGHDPFAPVVEMFVKVVQGRGTLTLVGIPLFVWTSTRLFGSLRATLNEVFDTEENRDWVRGKLVDIALVLVAGLLFLFNTLLTEGMRLLAPLMGRIGFTEFFLGQTLGYLSILTMFSIVFRYAPARGTNWRTASFAAVLCTVGFELAKVPLAMYFQYVAQPERMTTDATIGGIIVFVAWMYYMTYVFLIGGEIAQVYTLRRRQAQQRALLG